MDKKSSDSGVEESPSYGIECILGELPKKQNPQIRRIIAEERELRECIEGCPDYRIKKVVDKSKMYLEDFTKAKSMDASSKEIARLVSEIERSPSLEEEQLIDLYPEGVVNQERKKGGKLREYGCSAAQIIQLSKNKECRPIAGGIVDLKDGMKESKLFMRRKQTKILIPPVQSNILPISALQQPPGTQHTSNTNLGNQS